MVKEPGGKSQPQLEHMRETKFRAWNKKEKRMFKVYRLRFKGYGYDDRQMYDIAEDHLKYYKNCSNSNQSSVILMQYIDLKDKNGVGVYIKDIYKDEVGNIGVIEWDYPLLARLQKIRFEVIGNLYENKDLLVSERSKSQQP